MARHLTGVRGLEVLGDPTWQLFYLSEAITEKLFVEAQQANLLKYQAAGSTIRVDYPAEDLEEYARTLAKGAD